MLPKNFSIENCESLLLKVQFLKLKKFLNELRNIKIINDPILKACIISKNINSTIEAKQNLQKAILDKVLIDNPQTYIYPNIYNEINYEVMEDKSLNALENVKIKKNIAERMEQNIFFPVEDEENNFVLINNDLHYQMNYFISIMRNISIFLLLLLFIHSSSKK